MCISIFFVDFSASCYAEGFIYIPPLDPPHESCGYLDLSLTNHCSWICLFCSNFRYSHLFMKCLRLFFFKGAHSEFSMLKFLCDFIHTVHTAIGTVNFLIGFFIVFIVSKKWDSIVSECLKVIIVTFLALNILGYKQVLNIVWQVILKC